MFVLIDFQSHKSTCLPITMYVSVGNTRGLEQLFSCWPSSVHIQGYTVTVHVAAQKTGRTFEPSYPMQPSGNINSPVCSSVILCSIFLTSPNCSLRLSIYSLVFTNCAFGFFNSMDATEVRNESPIRLNNPDVSLRSSGNF